MEVADKLAFTLAGVISVDVYQRGVLVDQFVERNLIVDNAKLILSRLLGSGASGKVITQIGFGTSGAAPASSNTGLTGAYLRALSSPTYPATNQVRFPFTLGTSEANGMAILEFGLYSADSTLFSRRTRGTAINKDNTISLTGTWTISF